MIKFWSADVVEQLARRCHVKRVLGGRLYRKSSLRFVLRLMCGLKLYADSALAKADQQDLDKIDEIRNGAEQTVAKSIQCICDELLNLDSKSV